METHVFEKKKGGGGGEKQVNNQWIQPETKLLRQFHLFSEFAPYYHLL